MTRKNCVTSDCRQIWPTGKLIDLANHLPSSSPRGILSFTQRFFQIWYKWRSRLEGFCCGFCEEWKLVSTNFNQIQVKQIILKDSGDTKQNKRENRGKKTVRIFDSNSPIYSRLYSGTHSVETPWNPSRWAFCLQSLAYFDDLYQWIHVCLFLTRYFTEKLKSKASFKGKYRATKWR